MDSFIYDGTCHDGTVIVSSPSKQGGWIQLDEPEVRQAVYAWRISLVARGVEKKAGEDVLFHFTNIINPKGNGNGNKIPPKKGDRVRCCVRIHRGQPKNLRQRIVGNPVEVIA